MLVPATAIKSCAHLDLRVMFLTTFILAQRGVLAASLKSLSSGDFEGMPMALWRLQERFGYSLLITTDPSTYWKWNFTGNACLLPITYRVLQPAKVALPI